MENADPQSPRTPSDAEARLATILKCDIADSTRTWAKLDLSDGLKLTRAFRRAVADVVERHGGQVVAWEGDGALVLFGFPDAREDAPETAVRAGLQLVHAVRSVQVADVSINLRVGISSGRIAVDLVNKLLDGMEFNIAERLQAAGKPGWVVVTDGTKRLAKNFFEYDDLGLLPARDSIRDYGRGVSCGKRRLLPDLTHSASTRRAARSSDATASWQSLRTQGPRPRLARERSSC